MYEIEKLNTIKKQNYTDYNWSSLSINPNITIKFIEQYINKDWNWDKLSLNLNIRENFIEKYINKNWNYEFLSENISSNLLLNSLPEEIL